LYDWAEFLRGSQKVSSKSILFANLDTGAEFLRGTQNSIKITSSNKSITGASFEKGSKILSKAYYLANQDRGRIF